MCLITARTSSQENSCFQLRELSWTSVLTSQWWRQCTALYYNQHERLWTNQQNNQHCIFRVAFILCGLCNQQRMQKHSQQLNNWTKNQLELTFSMQGKRSGIFVVVFRPCSLKSAVQATNVSYTKIGQLDHCKGKWNDFPQIPELMLFIRKIIDGKWMTARACLLPVIMI